MSQGNVPPLSAFKERVERKWGQKVYGRMVEQSDSQDFLQSNCAGLVLYLLGMKPTNTYAKPFSTFCDLGKKENLVAFRAGGRLTLKGNLDDANVCAYLTEGADRLPFNVAHIAFMLGEIDGVAYEFSQILPSYFDSPELAKLAKARVDTIPSSRFDKRDKIKPTHYYKLPIA